MARGPPENNLLPLLVQSMMYAWQTTSEVGKRVSINVIVGDGNRSWLAQDAAEEASALPMRVLRVAAHSAPFPKQHMLYSQLNDSTRFL